MDTFAPSGIAPAVMMSRSLSMTPSVANTASTSPFSASLISNDSIDLLSWSTVAPVASRSRLRCRCRRFYLLARRLDRRDGVRSVVHLVLGPDVKPKFAARFGKGNDAVDHEPLEPIRLLLLVFTQRTHARCIKLCP